MKLLGENLSRFKLRQYNYVYLEMVKVLMADFEARVEFRII